MAEAGQGGVGEKALAVVAQGRAKLAAMPAGRRTWLLGAIAMVLALVAGMAWYVNRPDYRMLYSGLEGKDVQVVAQELGAAGIPFEMTADGTGIEVPAEQMDKARMEVAAKGMPQSGRMGFELFDKPNWVGSEFDERVNYQRAMEGELEHTIATLGVVRSARVHLVLPQQSLFTSEEKMAKASVVLKLKRASLDPEQTESIRNLVAGAVENLSPSQVTLVDADGRVNLEAKGRGAQAGDQERDQERELEQRLVAVLEPLAGTGNVRATVNVTYDEGTEEKTDEVYDPEQTAVLTSQKSEQMSGGARAASGVPGTASNTPAAAPAGAVQGSVKAAAPGTPPLLQQGSKQDLPVFPQSGNGGGQSTKEESGTYAVTRHLTHTEQGPGRVRRLTAAVVVNDRMTSEGVGKALKTVWKPRTAEEMHRLEQLAQAAVGFDGDRGDRVVLENVGFSTNAPEPLPTGMDKALDEAKSLVASQPAVLKTATTGVLGLMVVLLVLKPMAGQVVATLRAPMQLAAGEDASDARMLPGGRRAESPAGGGVAPQLVARVPATEQLDEPRIFDEVSNHIKRDPVHSTRLIEAWIASDDDF